MATTTVLFDILARDRASHTIDKVGNAASTTTTKMEKFHKVGAAAGVALAAGLVLAGKAAVDMTKAAADDEASAARLAQTLHKATGATTGQVAATEKWITKQAEALGVAKDDLRPALSKLAVATGSVSKAQKLASLSMDVAAGTGRSLSSVSLALAKAQNGSTAGLARLGIATKDAAGNTLSLKQVTQELTDHFKGAAAAAAKTTAGRQQILTVRMHELEVQIGQKLLPVMLKLVDIGLKVVDWVSKNTTTVGILLGVLGGLLAVTWAVSAAMKAWAAITKIAAAAQWLFNAAMDANPIGLVVIAVAALVAGFIIAYKHSETFRKIVDTLFGKLKSFGSWLKATFVKTIHLAAAAWDTIKKKISDFLGFVKGLPGKITAFLKDMWKGAKDAYLKFAQWEWDKLGELLAFIKGLPAKIRSGLHNMWDGAKEAFTAFGQWERDKLGELVDWITGLGTKFLDAGKHLMSSLWKGFLAAAGNAGGFVSNLVDKIKAAINSALNLPLEVNFDKGPLHIHATLIPALAQGGIVNRPTLAMIGEAGPEAVVPLSGRNARGLGGDIYITVNASGLVDAPSMAKQIEKELTKLKRVRGGAALGFV